MYHLAQSEESGRKPDFALGEDGTVRVVAELGYTQTPASLSAAVHWWLESSGTTVELVITIRMRQATHGLEVTAWELRSRASTSTRRRNPITAIQCRQLARSPEPPSIKQQEYILLWIKSFFYFIPYPTWCPIRWEWVLSELPAYCPKTLTGYWCMPTPNEAHMQLCWNSTNIDGKWRIMEIIYTWQFPRSTWSFSIIARDSLYIFPRTIHILWIFFTAVNITS